MGKPAIIKSFTLKLDKVQKGKPKPVTIGCVYSCNPETNMLIGYILAVDGTITEMRCFTLGIKGQRAFMNTDKTTIQTDSGDIICYRVGFSDDEKGGLSGFMMQGEDGDDIIATSDANTDVIEALKSAST